ncbi:DUF930 domain-containing protein [Rhizobium sp. SL86]|uniref:DUF930 domain-containing protein n=1 Tax=Rhizobium sp. SL86 TaxID=2995148 RepID=UPI002275490E|nr:DUF930 domain-containing protein [Rhizobium sp. SL86]MCY1664236.1 DUF930 domain-containing protein [Rhizobium sp. SL86]
MTLRSSTAAVGFALMTAFPAHALDSSIVEQLDRLTPEERREQRCDIEAMSRISKNEKDFRPDKVIAYTFADTVEAGDFFKAPGAVFRSKGEWYRLKYKCKTAEDGLTIQSFDYKVGAKVPRDEWSEYYLYE